MSSLGSACKVVTEAAGELLGRFANIGCKERPAVPFFARDLLN